MGALIYVSWIGQLQQVHLPVVITAQGHNFYRPFTIKYIRYWNVWIGEQPSEEDTASDREWDQSNKHPSWGVRLQKDTHPLSGCHVLLHDLLWYSWYYPAPKEGKRPTCWHTLMTGRVLKKGSGDLVALFQVLERLAPPVNENNECKHIDKEMEMSNRMYVLGAILFWHW